MTKPFIQIQKNSTPIGSLILQYPKPLLSDSVAGAYMQLNRKLKTETL